MCFTISMALFKILLLGLSSDYKLKGKELIFWLWAGVIWRSVILFLDPGKVRLLVWSEHQPLPNAEHMLWIVLPGGSDQWAWPAHCCLPLFLLWPSWGRRHICGEQKAHARSLSFLALFPKTHSCVLRAGMSQSKASVLLVTKAPLESLAQKGWKGADHSSR